MCRVQYLSSSILRRNVHLTPLTVMASHVSEDDAVDEVSDLGSVGSLASGSAILRRSKTLKVHMEQLNEARHIHIDGRYQAGHTADR